MNFKQSLLHTLQSELHIFDIRNDKFRRYKLDRLINSCAIDFKNKIIYAIEDDDDSKPLVKYEMD